MLFYRYQIPSHGEVWPFARWQYYRGGYKNAPNAPASHIDEWNIGVEWQIRKEFELVCEYLLCDRTNLRPETTGRSYEQFEGQVLRFQFQINY
jgi:phosphate-selective porin